MDSLTKNIAENLALIRKKNNYSLDDLAKICGVSKSMLRQIEKGESSPSISTVWKIANGLKVSFTSLLAESGTELSSAGFKDNDPIEESKGSGYRLFPLMPYDESKKFETYYIEIDYNSSISSEGHNGDVEEYIFVYSGCLTIRLADEIFHIGKEHSVRFKASREHAYANNGKEMVRAIMLIYYG